MPTHDSQTLIRLPMTSDGEHHSALVGHYTTIDTISDDQVVDWYIAKCISRFMVDQFADV